ncbi:hypothetical protein [Lutimonas zeaxanthinifaciens]|uniref:hypothetical protein n=1 Tax=Lutimonas zeaxanthinifaciens TaxID=3060215 RepID=UPI00265CF9BF|nr:hypothetical protein [Lutimonas sp. YSD2104]WKK64887.1 hypothetical protein QZH61_09855 [Lutimonas sp. YSD2104]
MKNITLLLSLFAFLILSPKSMAQEEVPKELLLSTLNSVAHLNLEKEPLDQLLEYNEEFVDRVYEILESDQEDKQKKQLMKALAYTREKELRGFLSKHKTNKYLKLMEDEMRPLTRKEKLLKPLAKG